MKMKFILALVATIVVGSLGYIAFRLPDETTRLLNSGHLEDLIRLAHGEDKEVCARARGKLLSRLTPGMTREDVEKWLGPGAAVERDFLERGDMYVIYYCWPPDNSGTTGVQLMTVHYRRDGDKFIFTEVRGPHSPRD